MEISLFFKQYELGKITKKNNAIVYNSNLEGEKSFKDNCFSSIFYPFFNSKDVALEETTMPNFLSDYIKMCENEFLSQQAKIENSDDMFTRLYKLAKLKFDDFGFYIKAS